MRLVMMNGGLGNQVFQYIFARYIEEKTGESCMIDDLCFHCSKVYHNGYEMEKIWGLKLNLLSDYFEQDVIQEMCHLVFPSGDPDSRIRFEKESTPLVDIFRACGTDLTVVEEGSTYHAWRYEGPSYSVPMNQFFPEVLQYTGDLYYYGWWINGHWFAEIRDVIWKELAFTDPPDSYNKNILKQIQATDSVSLHIRRGSFINEGLGTPSETYYNMVMNMKKAVRSPTFFLFSDDLPWVKEHMEELGFSKSDKCVFVEGNINERSYLDLQLMSNCKGMIVTNSSFSYLAAILNHNLHYYVGYSGRQVPGIHF